MRDLGRARQKYRPRLLLDELNIREERNRKIWGVKKWATHPLCFVLFVFLVFFENEG